MMDIRRRVMEIMASGTSIVSVEFVKTYTVTESWEADAKGNPSAILTALDLDLTALTDYAEAYLCVFENNNASSAQYKCDYIYYTKGGASNNTGSYAVRGGKNTARGAISSTSAYASIGTEIQVYKLTYNI